MADAKKIIGIPDVAITDPALKQVIDGLIENIKRLQAQIDELKK